MSQRLSELEFAYRSKDPSPPNKTLTVFADREGDLIVIGNGTDFHHINLRPRDPNGVYWTKTHLRKIQDGMRCAGPVNI